jgi:hypothetical protein
MSLRDTIELEFQQVIGTVYQNPVTIRLVPSWRQYARRTHDCETHAQSLGQAAFCRHSQAARSSRMRAPLGARDARLGWPQPQRAMRTARNLPGTAN